MTAFWFALMVMNGLLAVKGIGLMEGNISLLASVASAWLFMRDFSALLATSQRGVTGEVESAKAAHSQVAE